MDIAHFNRLVSIKINGFTRVATSDIVVQDGVIHIVHDVLIPPKKPGSKDETFTIEELKERLEPFIGDQQEDMAGVETGRIELWLG